MTEKNSIRINRNNKNIYEIEVNDKGETIIFDLEDVNLTAKLIDMYTGIQEIERKFNQEKDELEKREYDETDSFIPQRAIDENKLIQKFFADSRACADLFLGTGACQKIFGDKNYIEMFTDLFNQLEPHFKKMGLSMQKLKKDLVKKYQPNNRKVLK